MFLFFQDQSSRKNSYSLDAQTGDMNSPSSTPPDSPFQRIVNYPWSDSDEDCPAPKDFGLLPTSQTTQEVPPEHCSEEQAEAMEAPPHSDSDSDEETASPAKRSRRYAIPEAEIPSKILKLLKEMSDFFTKPMNLKRFGPALSSTTHDKTRERIRCK